MLPLRKILCPTDFSEPSYNALNAANELALHFSAALVLVHVVQERDALEFSTFFSLWGSKEVE